MAALDLTDHAANWQQQPQFGLDGLDGADVATLSSHATASTSPSGFSSKYVAEELISHFIQAGLDDGNRATRTALLAPDGTARLTRRGITLFELANQLVENRHMTYLTSAITRRSAWKRSKGRRCGQLCWPSAAAVDGMRGSVRAAARSPRLCRHLLDLGDGG
jgi:hypothetical protein